MYYGYDVKNHSAELIVASEVFMTALSPVSSDYNEMTNIIGKVMIITKAITRSIPFVSGGIGALFDSAQMQKVLEYADVFYNKRFLLEKKQRINILTGPNDEIIDVEYVNDCY